MNVHNLVSGLSVEDIIELIRAIEASLYKESYQIRQYGKQLVTVANQLQCELDVALKATYSLNETEDKLITSGSKIKAIQSVRNRYLNSGMSLMQAKRLVDLYQDTLAKSEPELVKY